MPALGADMEVGTILEWLVKPGDAVKRGDIIAVVDTEKATIEVEVFEAGVIQKIVVPVGERCRSVLCSRSSAPTVKLSRRPRQNRHPPQHRQKLRRRRRLLDQRPLSQGSLRIR